MANARMGGVLDRRRFVLTAAGTISGGIASLGTPSAAAAAAAGPAAPARRASPAPNPIPGGIQLAPGVVIHVFAPGDPAITLPFSGVTLQGLDVEPTTITDFNGSSAVAFHVGTARARDGRTYNLETDIRAFEGEYVAGGAVQRGSFAFI